MNKDKLSEYITKCKTLVTQGTYIINSYESLPDKEILDYKESLNNIIGNIKIEFYDDELIVDKANSILNSFVYIPSNKIFKKIQYFFTDWFSGVIGNERNIISLKKSSETYKINYIVDQLNGLAYYLQNYKLG